MAKWSIPAPWLRAAALLLFTYSFGLWWYGVPLTGDQKVYVSTALEMHQAGEWLHPILMGETSYIKPPLQLWATIVGWKVFGLGPFGTFFPSVLAMLGTALAIMRIRTLLDPRAPGDSAGFLFAATAGALTYSNSAQMECWIVLFYTAAWWAGLEFLASKKTRYLYLALFFTGVTAFTKSPLYSVFWVAGFALFLSLRREWPVFRDRHLYLATLFGVAVATSWYAAVLLTDQERFWERYVAGETLAKAAGNGGPLGRMWGDFLVASLPAGLLLPGALIGLARARRELRTELQFLLSWCLLPMVFFSVFPYRTETYLYVCMPALALAIDCGLERIGWRRLIIGIASVLVLVLATVIAALFWASGMLPPWVAILLPAAAALAAYFSRRGSVRGFASGVLVVLLALRLAIAWLGEDDVRGLRVAVGRSPERRVSYWDGNRNWWNEVGLLSVASRRPGVRRFTVEEIRAAAEAGDLLVLSDADRELLAPQLQGVRCEHWSRWNRGFLAPKVSDLKTLSDPDSPGWKERFRRSYWVCALDLKT